MTNDDHREPVAVERETLLAYEAPPAPADMADRVLAALRTDVRPRRSRRTWWMIAGASLAAATAVALFLSRGEEGRASAGRRVAAVRESIAIGDRAVAVAEAGSELAWTVLADGAATVDQARGNVFYRVTPGQPFVVALPGATVRVLGTSFRVEETDMRARDKALAAGGVGAALTAAVLVTVYEGRVLLGNEQGEVELAPGEQGMATVGAPPARTPSVASASAGDPGATKSALEARVRDLEKKLRHAEEMLAQAPARPTDRADQQFAGEKRDPSWAPRQERRILERLTRFMGLERGSVAVECHRTCCQISMDPEQMRRVAADLQSDVGLRRLQGDGGGSTSFTASEDGASLMSFCVYGEAGEPGEARPDRGAEREALLAAARPAIEACMRGAAAPLDFETELAIDLVGAIHNVTSRAEPVGHPAALCVEEALLGTARFAPSDRFTHVPIRLELEPRP